MRIYKINITKWIRKTINIPWNSEKKYSYYVYDNDNSYNRI